MRDKSLANSEEDESKKKTHILKMMARLKPSKSESFSSILNALTVNKWLYQIETYLGLLGIGTEQLVLPEIAKMHLPAHF